MINNNLVDDYLKEFAKEAKEWFAKLEWLDNRYSFFKEFFDAEKIKDYEWEDFQSLKNNLHSFVSMPIAGGNALGNPNLPIERYREIFSYIISEKDPINITINNLFKKYNGSYALPYFGESTVTELIQYAFPQRFVVYNTRTEKALELIGQPLTVNGKEKIGGKFKKFNEHIQPLLEAYESIVGKQTNTSSLLELDQFFSWLYEKKAVKPVDFKAIAVSVKQRINEDEEVPGFIVNKPSKNYFWIVDKENKLSTKEVHYEIIKRKKNVYVEVHFEIGKTKRQYQDLIGNLPEGFEWFDWENAKSIRVSNIFDIETENIENLLIENVLFLEATLGKRIREVKNEIMAQNRNYWLYAPGEGGRMWEQFYNEGIMALGWDDLGDLNEYDSKDDVVSKLQEINNTTRSKKNDATANVDFKNRMNVGDIVIVKKGLNTLLGYGEVSSDYYFDDSQENFKSRRKVNWKTKGNWDTGDQNLVLKTLTDITSYQSDNPEYKYYYEKLLGFMKNGNLKTNMNQSSKTPLNTILYGPPGTGKTFKLKEKYFDMFTISESSLSKEQFIINIVADLTWWQTFAIALLDLGRSSVNQLLEHEIVKAKASLSNAKNIRPIAWSRMQAHTVPECPNVNVADSSEPSIFYKESNSEWHVITEKVEGLYPEGIKVLEKLKNYKPNDDISIKNFEFVTFHQSFGYEDFIEGIKPKLEEGNSTLEYEIKDGIFKKLCQRAIQDPQNKYAIFIDEINRGNVSAIFGELITLIEDDKRIGNPQELRLKLPYSKTEFGLPSNLFIIGTMNTADRSVEALDTALRRRFSFQEVMPDPKLLMGIYYDGFNLEQVLTVINNRIEALLDRDHTIGHSYFMGLNSGDTNGLLAVFENKIIPLLQEYFYQDYEKLALVLGSGFVKIKNVQNVKFANFKGLEEPEIVPQFDLIDEIIDIELAVRQLLNIE